jgi:protein-tyrosine phosphatase
MAQAIAQHLLMGDPPSGVKVHVRSAGLAAHAGEPANRETAAALASLGVDPLRHQAQMLTREMLETATVVYAMTQSHARQVRGMSGEGKVQVELLDPSGKDIPDPIGQGPEVYRQTATKLQELVRARLRELVPVHTPKEGAG